MPADRGRCELAKRRHHGRLAQLAGTVQTSERGQHLRVEVRRGMQLATAQASANPNP